MFLLLEALREFGEISLRAGPVGLIADASVGLFAGLFIGLGVEDFLGGEILLSAVVVFAAPKIAGLGDPGFLGKALEAFVCTAAGFWGVCLTGAVIFVHEEALSLPGTGDFGGGIGGLAGARFFAGTRVAFFNFGDDGFSPVGVVDSFCSRCLVQFCMQKVEPKYTWPERSPTSSCFSIHCSGSTASMRSSSAAISNVSFVKWSWCRRTNGWVRALPASGTTVFAKSQTVMGTSRLIFGTECSFTNVLDNRATEAPGSSKHRADTSLALSHEIVNTMAIFLFPDVGFGTEVDSKLAECFRTPVGRTPTVLAAGTAPGMKNF